MTSCPICIVGAVHVIGSHEYCEKCNFIRFAFTDDYLVACGSVLAVLVSNTKFKEYKSYKTTLMQLISTHLPMMMNWLDTMAEGQKEFLHNLAEGVQQNAINLQIEDVVHNEEKTDDLVCQCGAPESRFKLNTVGELVCQNCTAIYKYSLTSNRYEPHFLCECGDASYEDHGGGLVSCLGCRTGYTYNKVDDTFTRLTS
jgi:hypothetical protein